VVADDLLDFVGDVLRAPQSVRVALDVVVDAIRALEQTAALRLNRIGSALVRVAGEVHPAERLAARGSLELGDHRTTARRLAATEATGVENGEESIGGAAALEQARHPCPVGAAGERREQGGHRGLPLADERVVRLEILETIGR